MINNAPFVGRHNAKRLIRSILSSSWETTIFNIFGMYGSGKTAFSEYIKQQIESGNWSLISQDAGKPKVIFISGKSFGKQKETFINFLYQNLQSYLGLTNFNELGMNDVPLYAQLRSQLLEISLNKHPLIIIVDDFARIMEHIEVSEVFSLNSLLVPGVHYIFITDHRNLGEIDPAKYSASPFFHTAVVIPLFPLSRQEARELITSINEYEATFISQEVGGKIQDYSLEEGDFILIQKLAGGHAGLLVSLTKLFHYEKFERVLDGKQEIQTDQDKRLRILLYKVLQDGSVKEYLYNIAKTLDGITFDVQYFLLSVAIQDRNKKKGIENVRELGAHRSKLVVMNLINEDLAEGDYIPGELIRFTILRSIIDKPFSGFEEALLKLLKLRSPELVSFAMIEKELAPHMIDLDEATKKRLINSTISRLRKKIATSVNPRAFHIENIRGEGFCLKSLVTLEAFFEQGSSTFS